MSNWWVTLRDANNDLATVERFKEPSSPVPDFTDKAELGIPHSYTQITRFLKFHFRDGLAGKKASDTISVLEKLSRDLGDEQSDQWWKGTPGNVGHAASVLLKWAKQHPDYVWKVS